ncbi:MAG: hypothetical protein K1W22_05715 [Lachnospiraceae bacterium]
MERSNLLLCNITKKSGKSYLFKRSVLKRMKEVSERPEPIENIFSGAYTECQKSDTQIRDPKQEMRADRQMYIESAWRPIRPDGTWVQETGAGKELKEYGGKCRTIEGQADRILPGAAG